MLSFTPLAATPVSTEPLPEEVVFISHFTGENICSSLAIHLATFISDLTIATDSYVLLVIKPVDMISYLEISNPSWEFLATRMVEMISYMSGGSTHILNVVGTDGVEQLDLIDGMVWAVNIETGASSQYEQYGFNSFFKQNGVAHGIANDGIYKLTGDDDAGADISALINFGKTDYGISYKKKVPYIYVGIGSTGKVYMKCNVDGDEYVYEMRSSSTSVKNHRVDTGKGLEGNYWNMTLINKEGADFVLATVQFQPLISSRRI